MKILIVEDEEHLADGLRFNLEAEGYEAEIIGDGGDAVAKLGVEKFDAVILDVMLPTLDGFEVARSMRAAEVYTPILMLTAKGETIDKVLGLKLGADDYLTKPFEVIELLARVEALLRRSPTRKNGKQEADAFRFGDVSIDFRRAEVVCKNEHIDLSAMEFKLLQFLIENRGIVHSRDSLLDAVWGYDAMPTTRTVDVHIAGLRQKLEDNPRHPRFIQTVHGLGYKFIN